MAYETAFPGEPVIQDELEAAFMALGWPADLALFSRTSDDFEKEIYLVSPAVRAACPSLLALREWIEEPNWGEHKWAGLLMNGDPTKRFGIELGSD